MTLRRLKWLAVLAPVLFLGGIELIRQTLFPALFRSWPGYLHLGGVIAQGRPMIVVTQDGCMTPQASTCDTLTIAPRQRFETIVEATESGVWAFHCHILNHAESEHGMFGMVTAIIVEE